jgi:uncharacterized protein (DUF1697 family)
MPSVVFIRAANVGGHQKFLPAALARDMADFGMVNIGAVGTFVVRKSITPAALRAEILRRLPFKTEIMICSAREVLELERNNPFEPPAPGETPRQTVSVMKKALPNPPATPIELPPGGNWGVKILGIRGKFVFSIWREYGNGILYPSGAFEKHLGTPVTSRGWNTLGKIFALLRG